MSIDTRHPLFVDRVFDWEQMLDTYRGQRRVKEKGTRYLPPTSSMVADANGKQLSALFNTQLPADTAPGQVAYSAYLTRAVFPNLVRPAVEGFVGIMNDNPPNIELPQSMEPLRESATVHGESLGMLLRQIHTYQLLFGRMGLLVETPDAAPAGVLPFIAAYAAPRIINWDDGRREQGRQQLEFVVIDEGENERTAMFSWEFEQKYRVLIMSNQVALEDSANQAPAAAGEYQVALLRDGRTDVTAQDLITPSIAGNVLNEIPFVFVNTKDLVSTPDEPPLLGLSDLALTIYRGEADLRQGLFLQGQDTLVITGGGEEGEETRVGAGQKIELPVDGNAKYIGVSADGLDILKKTLDGDRSVAAEEGSKLLDFSDSGRQSGEALRIRMAAKTATIQNIAQTGAEGLQSILRAAARWIGADPEEVRVTPNLDFAEKSMGGKEMLAWMQARNQGAPISLRSIHRLMRTNDLTEFGFEQEQAEIESEDPTGGAGLGVPDDFSDGDSG